MRPAAVFLRGLAMGAADIVPGVSGGTVAFITGIYPRLLHSLRSFDRFALQLLWRRDWPALRQHVDAGFLLTLVAGIGTSVFSLARLLAWLLQHYPQPLWAFFFGLILASALLLLRRNVHWQLLPGLALLLGTGAAVLLGLAPRLDLLSGAWGIFLAGFIAICAMLLPGISGSFLLLLLGMYGALLAALQSFDLVFISLFVGGAICGLLCCSRVLHWLLSRFHAVTLALLTGFLFGSLTLVWPWQRTLSWAVNSAGQARPVRQLPVLPQEFLLRTGEDPLWPACVLALLCGFALVWLIDHRWGGLQVERQ